MQKKVFTLGGVIAAGALIIWGYQAYSARYPSTEDAYVNADVVRVAPRVTGRIAALNVTNQQHVTRGDLLFRIDPAPFQFALQQAEAQLALAQRQVAQAAAAVTSADAEVHNRQVLRDNANAKLQRARRLARKNYISNESITDAEADFKVTVANLQLAQAKLEEARRQRGRPGNQNDRVMQAQANLDRAKWQLDNTRVSAACSGQTGQLSLQPGNVVSADRGVFVLVCNNHYWVEANYKETQLARIRVGQPVDLRVDMYPQHHFHGVVDSISAAAGSVFSLLPPQNASGNWVKVIQRVPVRISIDNPDPSLPLRVGASTTVTIDTTHSATDAKQLVTSEKNSSPHTGNM